MNSGKNLQYNFPKTRGGGGSKAIWNFSEKTSVLVGSSVPYNKVETGHLPTPRQGMRAAVIDNQIYVTGGHYYDDDGHHYLTEVLHWDPSTECWQHSGNLAVPRGFHAAVAIPSSIIESECSAMFLKNS